MYLEGKIEKLEQKLNDLINYSMILKKLIEVQGKRIDKLQEELKK